MTEWRKAGESHRPMMAMAAAEVHPLAQVEGDIPDVHVITVRERRVTVDYPTIIQNNVNTDTIELDLDGEWDDMSVVLVLGPCGGATELAWHGEPLTLPSALAEDTGGIDVSVVGYSTDGDTRLVTVAAPSLLNVIKSGCTVGEAPGDETPDLIGQLVAAGDAANKAAQAANTAATAANGAAGKANTAASAANTAAGKANTAATKATDAATKATDAAGEATRAAQSANAAAEAASAAAEAARGNVLKGTLGPAPVLSADDAYATKPRRLTVFGNTRQNLWVNPSGTAYGITSTSNEDGTLTLSGTCTSTAYVAILVKYVYNVKPNTTYTASIDKTFKNDGNTAENYIRLFLAFGSSDNVWDKQDGFSPGSRTSFQFTTTSTTNRLVFGLQVYGNSSGVSVSGTYRVMLNEGSEAQPWCPPGLNSVDELSVVTAGKNMLDGTGYYIGAYAYGYATGYRDQDRRTPASFPYTTEKAYYGVQAFFYAVAGETYTFSQVNAPDGAILKYQQFWDGQDFVSANASGYTGCAASTLINGPVTFERSGLVVVLSCLNTNVVGVTWPEGFGIQLELGSTATAYEPPNITTTPINLQGHTLNALPDGTRDELHIDGGGNVVLEKRVGKTVVDGTTNKFARWGDVSHPTYAYGSMGDKSGSAYNVMSDKLAVATPEESVQDVRNRIQYSSIALPNNTVCASVGTDLDTANAWMQSNNTTVLFPLATPQTIPLTAVTLPTLPAPNITVYNDSDVPSDITLEYERDVIIAFDKLQAQVSATTVREATNG